MKNNLSFIAILLVSTFIVSTSFAKESGAVDKAVDNQEETIIKMDYPCQPYPLCTKFPDVVEFTFEETIINYGVKAPVELGIESIDEGNK